MELFTACPKGLEELMHRELLDLGAGDVRSTVAGVYAEGSLELVYRVCLWSRLANRVLLPLGKFKLTGGEDIYGACRQVSWQDHIGKDSTIAVQFTGANEQIRNTRFGAQRVKDAIVDHLLEKDGFRPDVDTRSPEILINARLSRQQLVISLDLSGGSLHRRGYRQANVPAPLKENLAAALLIRAGWPVIAGRGGALIDPLCGSGTLLIEAALMAADIAPGLNRNRFGFERWLRHRQEVWEALRLEAEQRKQVGLAAGLPEIRGYDKDSKAVAAAEENIRSAGLSRWVRVSAKPVQAFKKPTHRQITEGLLICNPPYGERWGEVEGLRPLYRELGTRARQECPGWTLAVFTGNAELAGELMLRAAKKFRFFNGTIPCQLLLFPLHEDNSQPRETVDKPLSEGAQMLLNRLAKNAARLAPWRKRENVGCYRLYDRDIPEYAVAIDIYGREGQAQAVHVQEYAPPDFVDHGLAQQRLTEVKQALLKQFPECRNALFFKQRRRQKGSDQYEKNIAGRERKASVFIVNEGDARLEVNLAGYLDTGLFLDHRPVRLMLHRMAKDQRFLNLFCYTGTATVQAALGGAVNSLSIDMSQTYLAWAGRNFALNGMYPHQHKILQEDCLAWLTTARGEFDLIFLDPPTFSNSSRMDNILDIQRDHADLIQKAMRLLAREGTLLFSTNFRRFKLDEMLEADFRIENISRQTVPPDFARNLKIHQCWRIRHG